MSDDEASSAPCPEPLVVQYCAVCTFPLEYCEFGPSPEDCLKKNGAAAYAALAPAPAATAASTAEVTEKLEGLDVSASATTATTSEVVGSTDDAPVEGGDADEPAAEGEGETKKKPKKSKKKGELEPKGITLAVTSRGKRKFVTSIIGLASYGIDLKQASKVLSSKFAASAAIIDVDELQIQGDRSLDLEEFLPTKYTMIPANKIKIKVVVEKDE